MELKEMIKIMQHFEDGGKVEYRIKKELEVYWTTVISPSWDWAYFEYRIKESKQKVTIEKWLMQDPRDKEYRIMETSLVDKIVSFKKIKLIESYEVEL